MSMVVVRAFGALLVLIVAFVGFAPAIAAHANGVAPQNLIARYGSAKFSSGTVGLVGQTFPSGIYNAGNFTNGHISLGSTVNIDDSGYDCWTAWNYFQVLCDPGTGADSQTTLTPGVLNSGTTFTIGNLPNPETQIGYVVIDLGQSRSFDTFQVYQMFSDGNVTWASLSTSSNTSNTWPTYGDGTWQQIVQGNVPAGTLVSGSPNVISGPANLTFTAVSSRYLLLEFKNDGTLDDDYYLEVPSAKLFLNGAPPPPPTPTPTPIPEPTPELAKTGNSAMLLVSLGATLLSVGVFTIILSRRQRRL